jgi:hypothetical protein
MRKAEVTLATIDHLPEIAKRESPIVPEVRKGRVIAFRVYSIDPDGVIPGASLPNGDLIIVNGHDLSSADKALGAYANLRNANHYTVDIERGGRRMTLELDPAPAPARHGSGTACPLRAGWDRGLREVRRRPTNAGGASRAS